MRMLAIALFASSMVLIAQDAPQPPRARVSSGVIAGQAVTKVQPVFPREAIAAHVNGAVVMHVIIGRDGHVAEVTAVSGPEMLRQAYMDAVTQWVFRPYLLNGQPVEVDTTITLSFQMGGPGGVEQPALPPGRVRVSSGVMAGQILSKAPIYVPPLPPDAKVSGGTVLHAVIGREGTVLELTPVSGPEILRGSVMDAVRQWRYKPYLLNGEPVEVDTTITIHIDFGG
jgi:outer membrane biosynthesis protein TonB